MPKEEHYDMVLMLFDRQNPIIITEISKKENRILLENSLKKLGEFIRLDNIISPLALYETLSKHRTELIIIDVDFVQLRKNYLDILQGAICSIPDSGALWTVEYLDKPAFQFKGRIILCTTLTKANLKSKKQYRYIIRDCQIL